MQPTSAIQCSTVETAFRTRHRNQRLRSRSRSTHTRPQRGRTITQPFVSFWLPVRQIVSPHLRHRITRILISEPANRKVLHQTQSYLFSQPQLWLQNDKEHDRPAAWGTDDFCLCRPEQMSGQPAQLYVSDRTKKISGILWEGFVGWRIGH